MTKGPLRPYAAPKFISTAECTEKTQITSRAFLDRIIELRARYQSRSIEDSSCGSAYNYRIPQLTYADDHPGEVLPAFRFAYEVTEPAN